MKNILQYIRLSFSLDLKRHAAYPRALLLALSVFPLWSVVQLLFLEVIFGQTNMFLGYTKYEAYILFGTYRMATNMGYFIFAGRIYDLKNMIRGTGHETFDMVLTKPIDSQMYVSLGRYGLGDLSQLAVGLGLFIYGIYKTHYRYSFYNFISWLLLFLCGLTLLYLIFLTFRSLIFWFQEFEVSEGFYEIYRNFGKYPAQLYQGPVGIILNLVVPITLTGSIPVDFLLGRAPFYMLFVYIGIIIVLFILTRLFWSISVKQYSSFSS